MLKSNDGVGGWGVGSKKNTAVCSTNALMRVIGKKVLKYVMQSLIIMKFLIW